MGNKNFILMGWLGFTLIFAGQVMAQQKGFFDKVFDDENPLTSVELGTEVSFIRYAEPNYMKQKGNMYGLTGGFTYRRQETSDIRSLRDIFDLSKNKTNMFRLDARISWGWVDYESEGTGTMDDVKDWMWEIRGVTGYDFLTMRSLRITPYVGFGFRYLNDDSSGKKTTTGHSGYERESHYFYLPIGVETFTPLAGNWGFGATVEFDVFLGGKQRSHLEDVLAGLGVLKNDQEKGYGIRGSLKLVKNTETINFCFEPFIRYWNIDDSEISPITYNGVAVGFGLEPENNSTEYGIKLGVQF